MSRPSEQALWEALETQKRETWRLWHELQQAQLLARFAVALLAAGSTSATEAVESDERRAA